MSRTGPLEFAARPRATRRSVGVRARPIARITAVVLLPLAMLLVPGRALADPVYRLTGLVRVGSAPAGVGVDLATHTVYVTNSGDGTVSVIGEPSDAVTTKIRVGDYPSGIGVDSLSHRVYASNADDNTVSVIDGVTRVRTATVRVGEYPSGVAVDAGTHTIYVANSGDDTVSVIDGATNTVRATIPVNRNPSGVSVDPTTRTVYVTDDPDTVSVIDGATNTVTATITVGGHPQGIGVDTNTATVYVADAGDNAVSVIDAASRTVTATISVGLRPVAVAVDPVTGKVYVANFAGGAMSVIDGTAHLVTAAIDVGGGQKGVVVDPGNGAVHVTSYLNDNLLSLIDAVAAPGAPAGVSVTAGDAQASVSFTEPARDGGRSIAGYTVTASDTAPGGPSRSAIGTASPITVTGLLNGHSYNFTVTASNAVGTGPASTPSAAVGPNPRGALCTDTITGTHRGPLLVLAGLTCLSLVTQDGPILVTTGAGLSISASKIRGPVMAVQATSLSICASAVAGPLLATGTNGPVTIGVGTGCGPVEISGAAVLSETAGAVTILGLHQRETLFLAGNRGGMSLMSSLVEGSVFLRADTGIGPILLSNDIIRGSLACTGNAQRPDSPGTLSSVTLLASGQCSTLGTR